MFLKNIRLIDFKCHESLFMDFSTGNPGSPLRKTSFLTGDNGAGKSALLQAIGIITGGSGALRAIPGMPDDFIRRGRNSCTLQATIINSKGEERTLGLKLERGRSPEEIIRRNRASLEALDSAGDQQDNFFTAGYGAGRRLQLSEPPASQEGTTSGRYEAIHSLFDAEAILPAPASSLTRLIEAGGNAALAPLKETLNLFLWPELRFKALDRSSGQLIFATPDGSLPLSALGMGCQQMTAWICDLFCNVAAITGDAGEAFRTQGLLLIDGIDLHLHPAWQRQIPAALNRALPNFQVIATTYSPHIAQQAGRHELYALRREEGRIQLSPFLGDPSAMLLHQLLMSPVFSLETDESLRVEIAKAAERAMAVGAKRGRPRKSAAEKAIGAGEESLPARLNTRSNSQTPAEDLILLQQINASLQAAQKGKGG